MIIKIVLLIVVIHPSIDKWITPLIFSGHGGAQNCSVRDPPAVLDQYLILSHSYSMLKASSQKSLYLRLKELETKAAVRHQLKMYVVVRWLKFIIN